MKKEGNNGRNFWKKYRGFIVIFLLFFVLLCVYPGSNLFTWIAAKSEIKSQYRQIRWYQKEIMRMDSAINTLSTNRDSLEKFARDNFHFTQNGEDVYLLDN